MSGVTQPASKATMPIRTLRVEVVAGPDRGRSIPAGTDVLTVGTAPSNGLILEDQTVSRFHLELKHRGDEILVLDLGSTNGTSCGNIRVDRAYVPAGTTLTLGNTQLSLQDGDTVEAHLHEGRSLDAMVGVSPSMRRLMAQIERAARSNASILLAGETGTGKEVTARALHAQSSRAGGPFEVVDCGSLSASLIASELFGHERGAFTNAERRHIGAFERAHGGTLFLDEIGELPTALQSALLGALERRAFRRVGGDQVIEVDVRVVAATNRDLRRAVNDGSFRADLYYRLAMVTLEVLPLRERREDIPILIDAFLAELGVDRREELFSDEHLSRLLRHPWHGNVRELRNYVEATLTLGEPPHLEDGTPSVEPEPAAPLAEDAFSALLGRPFRDARADLLRSFEETYLTDVVTRSAGNVSQAARLAKVSRPYMIDLLRRAGISAKEHAAKRDEEN